MNDFSDWEELYNHMRQNHPEQFNQAVETGNLITMRASGHVSPESLTHVHAIAAETEVRVMRLLHTAIHEVRGDDHA